MSFNNKKFLDANGVTQIAGLFNDYATNETLSTVVNSVQTALDQKVSDVQVNGSSILNNGVANIPIANGTIPGIMKVGDGGTGITLNANNVLRTLQAYTYHIKAGTDAYRPLTPETQHTAAFYALAKLVGADMAQSSNAIGTYTDAAKQGIQKLFGFEDILGNYESSTTASKAYTVGETFIFNGKRYRVTADIAQNYVITPGTNCELDPIDGKYVKNTDYATSDVYGLVRIGDGLSINPNNGKLQTNSAGSSTVKQGRAGYAPIVPGHQHEAAFYGLARAAGADLGEVQDVTVGTYPAEAKTAILTMLGANGSGLQILNGTLTTDSASTTSIKNASNSFAPIVSSHIHDAAFYGLAKAAGDTTQASSNNAVGTYTEAAKTAIRGMLGIDGSAAIVEEVTGTAPTIIGMPNVRYVCGEVSLLTITPPACGSIEVIFTSGSTASTLTVPNTVKWPAWFEAEELDSNMIYDIIITDAAYGAVMAWAN